jgi:hypothetical protein
MIQLGLDETGGSQTTGYLMNGINDAAGSNNYYYNSVYIGGSGVLNGTANTYAFNSSTTTPRNFINNAFYNARSNSGGTGKHYAVKVGGTGFNPTDLTMNNNLMYTSGAGGTFGYYSTADVPDLGSWVSTVGGNGASLSTDPWFAVPSGNAAIVDLAPSPGSPLFAAGVPVGGITTDLIGHQRNATTPTIGAGETSIPLPVQLISFEGRKQKQGVALSWVTASEMNNDYFVVQRSVNGEKFENLARVKGNGNTQKVSSYSYLDTHLPEGASAIYYRLQQVDFDRSAHASKVVAVAIDRAVSGSMQVAPNPFSDITNITVTTEQAATAIMRIVDLQGRAVADKTIELSAGINQVTIDELSSTAYSGIYFVTVVCGAEIYTQKIVKGH